MTEKFTFYPEIEPYARGRLRVSHLHELYYEECGNPDGQPAVVLHGGPGGGISANLRRYHAPSHYRIILFDQRGCGASTPHACLDNNTTPELVADMERLRLHLQIDRWQVFGGSWGSTLALAYAEAFPHRVSALIVRGIFTVRQTEIDWLYQHGASMLFPDFWEGFVAPIPEAERHDLIAAYHKRLTGPDEAEQLRCARAWSKWEAAVSFFTPSQQRVAEFDEAHFALAFARIECHYFINRGFFETDDQLLRNAHKLAGIPGVIVQGRYDVVTPSDTAWALHRAWPQAEFILVPDAGHAGSEPGTVDALVRATRSFVV
ncbi:MAG: prolyl aminopeptidase [Alphaproteobacteria bacterium]|nr:prolyl aminopeptidase [Alphaproteobacteria bacterium]